MGWPNVEVRITVESSITSICNKDMIILALIVVNRKIGIIQHS